MDARKRKRGIRASRGKLEAAMLAAGYQTQAELAKQMADDEGLAKPPKDLVNKVFREQAVSTLNLARVAKALGIEAHTIYLTRDDEEFADVANAQIAIVAPQNIAENKQSASSHKIFIFTAAIASSCIAAVLSYYINSQEELSKLAITSESTKIEAPLGKIRLVIQADRNVLDGGLIVDLVISSINELDEFVAINPSSSDDQKLPVEKALDNWQSHLILKLQLKKGEYYTQVSATLASHNHQRLILQRLINTSSLKASSVALSQTIVEQTKRFANGQSLDAVVTDKQEAFDAYSAGKNALFVSHSAQTYNQAIELFESSIELDANFALGYAELCRSYLRRSWIEDEIISLEKAVEHCATAESLALQNTDVVTANAELLSRTGQPQSALSLLERVVTIDSNNSEALAIRAAIHLDIYNADEDDDAQQIELATLYAKRAIDAEARQWRAFNTLGNMYFAIGEVTLAKEQYVAATKVVKHELILANLGTLQLCLGELDNAQKTYYSVIENFENNYIGYENLGTVQFFKKDYLAAINSKLIAINMQPTVSIHQVWGSLAEAYIQASDIDNAYKNFHKALNIIESDELTANLSLGDEVDKLYYQTRLRVLKDNLKTTNEFLAQIDAYVLNHKLLPLSTRGHLAWLASTVNLMDKSAEIWQTMSNTCPIYSLSPNFITKT